MTLLIVELNSELEQTVKAVKNSNIEAIRLHLYKHNEAPGSLQVLIKEKVSGNTIASSEIIDISVIPGDFFHGQVLFPINAQLAKNKQYKIVLQSIDYTFDEAAYIGWCIDYDFKTYNKEYDDQGSNLKSSFDYEIWTKKDLI